MSTVFHGITAGRAYGKPGAFLHELVAAGSTLLDGLVSWWDLDEESGTREDAVGSYDLTDVNTVGYEAGKIGNAAKFVSANSEVLRYAPASPDGLWPASGTSWTISLWLKNTYGSGKYFINTLGHNNVGGMLAIDGGAKFYCYVKDGSSTTGLVLATATSGVWQHIVWEYDSSAGKCRVYVNAGAPVETAATGYTKPSLAGTDWAFGEPNANSPNASMDLIGVWHRTLTADERTELYNAGDGVTHPF